MEETRYYDRRDKVWLNGEPNQYTIETYSVGLGTLAGQRFITLRLVNGGLYTVTEAHFNQFFVEVDDK